MSQLKISEWLADKPPIPAAIALVITTQAPLLVEVLNISKNQSAIKTKPCSQKQWLSYYRNWRIVFDNIQKFLSKDDCPKTRELSEEFVNKLKEEPNEHHVLTLSEGLLLLDIEDSTNPQPDEIEPYPLPLEFIFFLKVILPCWVFYKENHTKLFRKARLGDLDALDKLLRLDKSLIGDRLIAEQFHRASFDDPRKLKLLTSALNKKPNGKLDGKTIKISLACIVDLLFRKYGHKLKYPELQEIFNAMAIDHGRDISKDSELQDGLEAFAKDIKRKRPSWKTFVNNFNPKFILRALPGQK